MPAGWSSVHTRSDDGVRLAGLHAPGPGGPDTHQQFVVCHGMTNATAKPGTRRVLAEFARYGPVTAFDFRGHGASGGRSTVGDEETADAAAALHWARDRCALPAVLIGFSLGGAVVLRQQGSARRLGTADPVELADVIVSVSAPARWFLRESPSMRRVQWLLEHPSGAFIGPRLGIRLGAPWAQVPSTPLQEVAAIAPTPLLIVHGTRDHYFDVDQARALHRAAPGSDLLVVDGMGHAESGISTATMDRIVSWAQSQVEAQRQVQRQRAATELPHPAGPTGDLAEPGTLG